MKYLIVGLGNIGIQYEVTRHNIGFLILDRLVDLKGRSFDHGKLSYNSTIEHKGRKLYLIKPTTYMNLSGKAVKYWKNHLKIADENILIIADDIALPFGKIRIRKKGSHGGHNGLKDIESHLASSNYPRLRFGVGNEFQKGSQSDYVLSNFSKEEADGLVPYIDKCIEAILDFTTIGIDRTMNQYNG